MKKLYSTCKANSKAFNDNKRYLNILSILLSIILFHISASASVLETKVTAKYDDISLSDLFWEVQKDNNISFVYNTSDLNNYKNISIDVADISLKQFLDIVIKNTNLTYQEKDDVIIILNHDEKSMANGTAMDSNNSSKEIIVTGIILDETDEAIPGVNISIKGTSQGVSSNVSGKFAIKAHLNDTLIFSYIGYQQKEIVVKNEKELTVKLEQKIQLLEEVVVTGYQVLPRERSTGAFATVKSKDLDKQIGSADLNQKLQGGLIPGLLLSGENNEITIRGKSTLYAETSPLIVVDGYAIEGSISTINPNDIKSINVLRDAAAASIWGVRASNGVIVITTKGDKTPNKIKQKAKFDFSVTTEIDPMPDMSKLRLASSEVYVDYLLEELDLGYYNIDNPGFNTGYSKVYDIYRKRHLGEISEAEFTSQINDLKSYDVRNEDKGLFYRTGISQRYNLSASGSGDIGSYYFSVNYQDNKPYSRGNDNQLLNVMLKNNIWLTKKLLLNASVNVSYRKSKNNGFSMYQFGRLAPYERLLDDEGNYLPSYVEGLSGNSMTLEMAQDYEAQGYYNWTWNFKQEFDNSDNTTYSFSPRFNIGLNYQIIDGLNFDTRFMYERSNSSTKDYNNEKTWFTRDLVNRYTIVENGELIHQIPRGTILNTRDYTLNSYSFRNQLSFNKSLKEKKHQINAIVGTEMRKVKATNYIDRYHNFDRDKLSYSVIDEETLGKGVTNYKGQISNYGLDWIRRFTETENRYFAAYMNASYTFNQKYTASASFRIDQSNLFGVSVNDRITPLYSIGVAWNISKEDFFNVKHVDYLKLRLTTGVNGNADKKTSKELIGSPGKDYFTQEPYLRVDFPENRELKWESTRTFNFGIDFHGFNNKIDLTLDLYHKKSYDLLGSVASDPTIGFSSIYKNTAEMVNKGFDMILNINVIDKEVKWETGLNFSYNKNEVTKVFTPTPTVSYYLSGGEGREILGKPIDHLYAYQWAGLSTEGEPQIYDDKGNIISWEDSDLEHVEWLRYMGQRSPKFYGSWINTVSYKGFTLNAIFTYKLGHFMRLPSPWMGSRTLYDDIAKRWQKPGDELNTYVPKLPESRNSKYERYQFYSQSDYRVQSASYIRLSSLTLTYDLPKKLIGKYFDAIQLQAQGTNLWLWTKNDEDLDPEASFGGDIGFGRTPAYTLGIKVQF